MAFWARRVAHDKKVAKPIDWIALWILISTWCTFSGWLLSLLGILNQAGYTVSLLMFVGIFWLYRRELGFSRCSIVFARLWPFHPRRLLPKIWLLLTLLIFIGGLVYHPNNYDYLTYRFSRVLHWCWEQKWHWIDSPDKRMNIDATGFEWLMAPLFVFFKTDRLFFLVNIVSFLLLPRLVFSVFYRIGISRRLSWWWMWVLPCAGCYALQGGSVCNDLVASIYVLASFLYIFKTGEDSAADSRNFLFSALSLALATNAKASNLPLMLPWLVAVLTYGAPMLKMRPLLLAGILFPAACVSFLPTALLNIHFTGVYTGDPQNESQMQISDPVVGVIGNSAVLAVGNLQPPVWPIQVPFQNVVPAWLWDYMSKNYPRMNWIEGIGQVQIEEKSGVGVSIVACLVLMVVLGLWARVIRPSLLINRDGKALPFLIATWVALFVLMAKLSNDGMSRLITPYYPLLIVGILFLVAFNGTVIRLIIVRIFALTTMAIALLLVIINPARPLFPVQWAVTIMTKVSPSRVDRLERVYSVYGSRYDAMKDMRVLLPPGEKAVGFIQTGDYLEATLWRPYGSRQIIDVEPEETLDQLRSNGIHLVIASEYAVVNRDHTTIDDLLKKWSAKVIAKRKILFRVSSDTGMWYLIELPPEEGHALPE